MAMTLSVLLLVAAVAGIHGNPSAMRRRQMCGFVAMSCRNQFLGIVEELERSGQEPDIAHVCSVARQGLACMGGCMEMVVPNPMMVNALTRVLDYVCDEDRRANITRAANANCFKDGTIEENFEEESQECVQTQMTSRLNSAMEEAFGRGIYDTNQIVCPLVHDVIECIDGKVLEMCGADVVPVMHDIFTIVLREMLAQEMPNCLDQVTGAHAVMKRAVEFVKMIKKR